MRNHLLTRLLGLTRIPDIVSGQDTSHLNNFGTFPGYHFGQCNFAGCRVKVLRPRLKA